MGKILICGRQRNSIHGKTDSGKAVPIWGEVKRKYRGRLRNYLLVIPQALHSAKATPTLSHQWPSGHRGRRRCSRSAPGLSLNSAGSFRRPPGSQLPCKETELDNWPVRDHTERLQGQEAKCWATASFQAPDIQARPPQMLQPQLSAQLKEANSESAEMTNGHSFQPQGPVSADR